MNLQAQVVLPFADGNYTFALKCRELENLEKAVGASVADIAYRVIGFRPSIVDIKHIIILGLEGGGTPPEVAVKLFERYVDGRPIMQKDNPSSPGILCARIMEAAWFGVSDLLEDDDSGKDEAGETPAPDQQ